MPRVSAFYGIVIFMYWNEGDHAVAHFHAHLAGQRASISVDGNVLAGRLEARAVGFIREWAALRKDELWPIGSGPGDRNRWFPSRLSHKMQVMTYLPAVVGVAVVANYRLRLLFDDGTVGDVDFSAVEWRGVFEPLRDPSYFAQVRVDPEAGTIVWPNGLDMAPEPLYGEARRHPLATA